MAENRYKMSWPKDNLYVEVYVHQVQSFRYHWHDDDFELNILLQGKQHFYQGTDLYHLEEDDVVLVNPNLGHASYCDPEGTIAFVLHFSSLAFRPFVKKGQSLRFTHCLSDSSSRQNPSYKRIRMFAAQILQYLSLNDAYSQYMAKASMEMLIGTLCTMFKSEIVESGTQENEETHRILRTVLEYIEKHYQEKISLEDIAGLTGYNRTYISTLFHQTLGIRFYDYLIRLRLQKAIQDLTTTDKPLTEIALTHGFSDLKSFNARFKDMLKILPSEYRNKIITGITPSQYWDIQAIPVNDPLIREKLMSYMSL
ncbi:MAG: helix-turn-helix domain-containing protein [Solobacterium sp.]|nr:helix-turn-helix domain-containing protein [Solobacterium sp.]